MIQNHLTTFRENFPLTKVMAYDDCLVYSTRRGLAQSVAKDANEIIEKLGLELTAIPTSLSSQDSVCVQSQYTQL
jgi:hypothetical protein